METKACSVIFFLLVFVLSCCQSASVFRFANVFGDHMVLQQAPRRAQLWGYGEVGQDVIVTFAEEMYRTIITGVTSETDGLWAVLLEPTKSGGPYVITAYSVVKGKFAIASLKDVLFGDVWLCGGQSNMAFNLASSFGGENAIEESSQYPNIRVFTAAIGKSNAPLSELYDVRLPWSVDSPAAVGDQIPFTRFSAVCWYYGVQLYKKLQYPIGLVSTAYPGTPVEAWSSPDALAKCTKSNEKRGWGHTFVAMNNPQAPSGLWFGMLTPFLRMSIYGVVWYQGEQNADVPTVPYECAFPAMIDDWRAKWYESTGHNTNETFPFGFVQLSAVGVSVGNRNYGFAQIRWDQTARYGYAPNPREKNVFMAVAMDLGDPWAPFTSYHPRDKKDIGLRLARSGLSLAYGVNVYHTGPLLSKIKQQNSSIEVLFKSVFDKIEVRSTTGFEVLCRHTVNWNKAPITHSGPTSVTIQLPSGCIAVGVRYAWSDYPCVFKKCAIYSDDLPSPPFLKYGPF